MKKLTEKLRACPLFTGATALLLALAVACCVAPAREKSEMENRRLARQTAPDVSSVLSGKWMQSAENALADQFPLRDEMMLLNALKETAALRTEHSGVLRLTGGRLVPDCAALDTAAAVRAAEALAEIRTALDLPVTLLLAPLSSRLYLDVLPAGYVPADQAALTDAVVAACGDQITVLDCFDALAAQPDAEALFYRTDHHWTADGARCAYEQLCASWGLAPATPSGRLYAPGFYGSAYARAPQPLVSADTLTFDRFDSVVYAIDGAAMDGLWDEAALGARDKYAALLYGNPARATLTSETGTGTLLVLKDSYANALLPAVATHFARTEVVDLRYFNGDLAEIAKETEVEKVLCIYGMNTFLTDRSLALVAASFEN